MKHIHKMATMLVVSVVLALSVNHTYAQVRNTDFARISTVSSKSEIIVYNLDGLKAEIYKSSSNFDQKLVVKYIGNISLIATDLKNLASNEEKGTYEQGVQSGYSLSYKGNVKEAIVTIDFTYNHTKEQENELNLVVDTILSKLVNPNMTDLEKIKAVNDYVVLQTEYSFTNDLGISVYSPYAIIKGKKAVCQSYALFTYKMLDRLGFEVKYVVGYAGEDHAWNLVKLGSNWYHLDTTWNDPLPNRDGFSSYSYFLMSDALISKDHTWEVSYYPLANDNSYNYFNSINTAKTIGDYIYYISKIEDNNLYKIKIDGSGKKQLVTSRVQSFAIHADKIYYNNYSKGGYMYSINTDGTKNVQLNSEISIDLDIKEGILYYKTKGSSNTKSIVLEPIETL